LDGFAGEPSRSADAPAWARSAVPDKKTMLAAARPTDLARNLCCPHRVEILYCGQREFDQEYETRVGFNQHA
jgi:hypothetical protein